MNTLHLSLLFFLDSLLFTMRNVLWLYWVTNNANSAKKFRRNLCTIDYKMAACERSAPHMHKWCNDKYWTFLYCNYGPSHIRVPIPECTSIQNCSMGTRTLDTSNSIDHGPVTVAHAVAKTCPHSPAAANYLRSACQAAGLLTHCFIIIHKICIYLTD